MYPWASLTSSAVVVSMTPLCARLGLHALSTSAGAAAPIMVLRRARSVWNFTITTEAEVKTPIPGAHLCFRAPDRQAVDAFYEAALATGGCDDGAPGPRLTEPNPQPHVM